MEDFFARVWSDLVARPDGPMKVRIILQPLIASVFAIRAGLKDAREQRPPFLWALAFKPEHRSELLRSAWKDIGKVIIAAIILDVIYQFIASGTIYLGEAVIVAIVLAIIPYSLVRPVVMRVAGSKNGKK